MGAEARCGIALVHESLRVDGIGFHPEIFFELLMRTGYSVRYFPFPACPRAEGYVAEPAKHPVFTTEDPTPRSSIMRKYLREIVKDLRHYLLKHRNNKVGR